MISTSEIWVNGSEKVEHARLNARLHDYNVDVHFFRVWEVFHDRIIVFFRDALRIRANDFYVVSKRRRNQLLNLIVVVVVISNAKQRVNIEPNGSSKQASVHLSVRAHTFLINEIERENYN